MHNALKHAHGANLLRIGLHQERTKLVLAVEDNGCGFVPAQFEASVPAGAGVGLRSIEARVQLLGGRLLQRTAPGEGTRTQVELNHPEPEA